mmetsp:Transcript_31629/g.38712  ORF Transcript_31629/g.38712 Transcript_31629/m.38712 type:complete len:788 (+) Transcript_31629:102-2465(+)
MSSFLQSCLSQAPLLILLFAVPFSPVLYTLVVTLFSASSWLLWILVSLTISLLQLFFVVYQFLMVGVDFFLLSILKAYATLRSQIIYYSFLLVGKDTKRGRRRDWRRKLSYAEEWDDFRKIRIEEPEVPAAGDEGDDVTAVDDQRASSDERHHSFKSGGGARSNSTKRRGSTNFHHPPCHSPNSEMRKSQSCANFLTTPPPVSSAGGDSGIPHSHSHTDLSQKSSSLHVTSSSQLGRTAPLLQTTTHRLASARAAANADSSSLKFLLAGVVKRNHLNIDDALIDDARSVAASGHHTLSNSARDIIKDYVDEVEECLEWLSSAPPEDVSFDKAEWHDRFSLAKKLRQNMGCTALMLSGGGAQAMYHLGTIRALLESGVYDEMTVISGTSGGAISAGMCAMKTSEELLRDVCVDTVSTDFRLTGEMKKGNIRWFPTMTEMGAYWMKNKLLVDSADFKRCCDFYYGDVTFEEAFMRTKKNVCITVSASRSDRGAQRLLLNHISTPHVTISSAVAASCALPGVMAPAKLMTKNEKGDIEPFEVDGMEWIDGSVQADLPFRRISTLFNVSNYIVCQVNFHVVPFLNKPHHPNVRSLYWRIFQTLEWDIRNRTLNLSRLGLFPKIFGHDVSQVFKQKYHGNITIVPRFTRRQVFGLQVLVNPTKEDMQVYLKNGQMATWPYIECIEQMLRLEKAIEKCVATLQNQFRDLFPSMIMPEMIKEDSTIFDGEDDLTAVLRTLTGKNDKETQLLERTVKAMQEEILTLRRRVKVMEERERAHYDNGDGQNGAKPQSN